MHQKSNTRLPKLAVCAQSIKRPTIKSKFTRTFEVLFYSRPRHSARRNRRVAGRHKKKVKILTAQNVGNFFKVVAIRQLANTNYDS